VNFRKLIWVDDFGLALDPLDPRTNPEAAIVHFEESDWLATDYYYWIDLERERIFKSHLDCTDCGRYQWWKNGLVDVPTHIEVLAIFKANI